jgi:hypothetical protein
MKGYNPKPGHLARSKKRNTRNLSKITDTAVWSCAAIEFL